MRNNLGVKTFVLSTLLSIFACPTCAGGNISNAKIAEMKVKSVKINGYAGGRIDDCINHRVMKEDVDALVEPFRHRDETWRWKSEFWGKWTLGAIATYRYTGNAALYEKIAASVGQIIETQSPDGYIGNYTPEAQLKDWDIWGRKYTMLGLLSWYELSGKWFSYENGAKAYEMMSCYEGLLEYYKVTGNEAYYEAVRKSVSHIIEEEINIAGSGSSIECWYGGKALQTVPTYHTMETCVGFTWMQLCSRLLKFCGDSRYADQIEKTFYNAILGSMKSDGSQIAKYTPLEGWRVEGEKQCHMNINCCNANGPRAFAMIPALAYLTEGDCLKINHYGDSEAEISLDKRNSMGIKVCGNYPVSGNISIELSPAKPAEFTLALRIPEWSKTTMAKLISGTDTLKLSLDNLSAGEYAKVERKWKKGDRIELSLDLTPHLLELNGHQAIVRGPIVLARDSRFNDGFVDECVVIQASKDGSVTLTPAEDNDFAWMSFTAPMIAGADLEGNGKPRQIHLCDFASAGNTWDKSTRYKVWLPKTLNVMKGEYRAYNDAPQD